MIYMVYIYTYNVIFHVCLYVYVLAYHWNFPSLIFTILQLKKQDPSLKILFIY